MSARLRVRLAVALAAVAAAGVAVGATLLSDGGDESTQSPQVQRRAGSPPLLLDLGVRSDAEARALARASSLYRNGRRVQAARIFGRYGSLQAKMGAAFATWGRGAALQRVEQLARSNPGNAFAQLHLGLALLWTGRTKGAQAAWRAAVRGDPDTASAVRASSLLHPNIAPGLPFFVPSFPVPKAIRLLPVDRQVAALARAARGQDVRAKLLYGVALQRLGRPVSAERQFAAAAALAPGSPDAQVAAAVGSFDKDNPSGAFSRLGPLTRRFPHAASVRFHLGLMLFWIGQREAGKRQLALAKAEDPSSPLAREASRFLLRLESIRTK